MRQLPHHTALIDFRTAATRKAVMQTTITPATCTPEAMPADVLDALRARYASAQAEEGRGDLDIPMFRLDRDYILFDGHDTTRVSLAAVESGELYARFDRLARFRRATTNTPRESYWVPTSEQSVTGCDALGIAQAIWRMTVGDAV